MSGDQSHPYQPAFLVTLVDKDLVTTADPQEIDLQLIKSNLGGKLRGLNYIGMIEPAYYNSTFDVDGEIVKDLVSWHGHFLVWGIDQKDLAERAKRINTNREAVMPCLKAAHQKVIEEGQFGYKLWYILKAPRKEYSVGKRKKAHKKTGAARFKHNSRPIRPGARVKLFHLMKPLYLDQLAMAGGEGKALLKRIKTAALRDYRDQCGWAERRP